MKFLWRHRGLKHGPTPTRRASYRPAFKQTLRAKQRRIERRFVLLLVTMKEIS